MFYVAKEVNEDDEAGGVAASPVLGVSCWLAPRPASSQREQDTWSSWFQDWLLSFRQLLTNLRHFGHGGLITKRYWIWKARQSEAQTELWTDQERGYYFCNIVTVRPDAQGKGIGRKLFEAVIDRADHEGVKCYLESSKNEPNVQIYEKMGFRMVKTLECEDEGDVCQVRFLYYFPPKKVKLILYSFLAVLHGSAAKD